MMLMQKCLNIENDLGRKRAKKNEPRICDIDIIDYGQKILKGTKNKKLILPHPEMHKRNFVLLPLYEISQSWIHPEKKKKINKLIKSLNIEDLRGINLI
jgi:2-amino-4-hydroxy-6-hydroxymethyldihydropteridine diphosphokinase